MFGRSHKKKIYELVDAAKAFADANYREPSAYSGTVRHSRGRRDHDEKIRTAENNVIRSDGLKFSEEIVPENSGLQYSSRSSERGRAIRDALRGPRDRYDSRYVDRVVRNLLSDRSSVGAARALDNNTNMSFVDKMLEYIKEGHMRDSDVYKAANIDRRLFSKIASDRTYKPSKDTCIALALALRLSIDDANDILSRAGYTLSHSSKRDVVIEYFFRERVYDLNDMNEVLYRLGQKPLGR